MPEVRTWQLAAGAAVVGLALAAGAVAAAGPWDSGQRKAEREWAAAQSPSGGAHHQVPGPKRPAPAPSAPGVLTALGAPATAPAPAPASASVPGDLAEVLAPLLGDPGLGPVRTASVVEVATGRRLYEHGAADPMTPASTIKIATSAAALSALGPDHRIPTTVVVSKDGEELTLVGGGDPTLGRAALGTLADRTVRALRDRGTGTVRLTYDTSLYSGTSRHPIGPNGNLAPVSALMVGQGRINQTATGYATRTGDPAGDAARTFERLLTERGLAGEEASFRGAERAVTKQLAKLKLPLTGARFADGSGLNRADKLSAGLLTALLARAADPAHPELRPVLTGLPVAGFSGTLHGRYGGTSPGTGLVRAKTGTLTGVNALAGTVVAPDGRLLAFAFLAGNTPSATAAEPALDRLAAALAS
ncbi:D-alanyl-D-alanine carboxypeptidase [Streptomyces lunaelactis]|uniref:D-alanyl-D-alanine carboxypeptidase n=1 Tax=Streptomyces lunaelactis TaxID=1535768 RepID=UPI0028163553|nr:D-alanyl-D-alanine carboxypeptidase [Streptomyces lunaelactis]